MTRYIITYIMLFFLVVSCNKETTTFYSIKGKVEKECGDIMVFGLDNRYEKLDFVMTDEEGNFVYTLDTDTVVPLAMIMPDGRQITLFAEPCIEAELVYDSAMTAYKIINGGTLQVMHDSISKILEACENVNELTDSIYKAVETYPISEANIELLRRYVINVPDPNYQLIKHIISQLGGIIQDNEYLAITKKNIENRNANTLHKQFPSFTYITVDSCKEITLNTFNKKHLLITLWASWDEESRRQMGFLHNIDTTIKSKNFEILNIALDHDTAEWKRCLETDSIIGHNVCEEKAWNSDLISKFKIKSLPYSILVNPYQRIIRLDVNLEKDCVAIDSIVRKHDKSIEEQEKREKEKEKENKKKKNKKKTNKSTNKNTNKETNKEIKKNTNKETKKETNKDTNKNINKEINKGINKEINKDNKIKIENSFKLDNNINI